MGNLVSANMRENGTKFIERSVPTAVEKRQDVLKVRWRNLESDETHQDYFDTVLFAIGMQWADPECASNLLNENWALRSL